MRSPRSSAISCARWQRRRRSRNWSLTSLKEKLIKIGAKVVRHGRYVAFQMAEVAIPRTLFADILRLVAELGPSPAALSTRSARLFCVRSKTKERYVLMPTKSTFPALGAPISLAWVHE